MTAAGFNYYHLKQFVLCFFYKWNDGEWTV